MVKNRIFKMAMSAVAAAYVAVIPVLAKEGGEEFIDGNAVNEEGAQAKDLGKEQQTGAAAQDGWEEGSSREDFGETGAEADGKGERQTGETEADGKGNQQAKETKADGQKDRQSGGAGSAGAAAGLGQEIAEGMAKAWESGKEAGEESGKGAEYGPHMLLSQAKGEPETEEEPSLYSEEDLYILAHAICGEGQGYPDDEQLYIGSVILNRRAHGAYPDTIKGVVFQRGQYACTWDGNYDREPTEANWRNARWLLENGSILPGNVVYQAGFRQGSGLYVQTRYHKYCYR